MARTKDQYFQYFKALSESMGADIRLAYKMAPYAADLNNGMDFSSDEDFDGFMDFLLGFDDHSGGMLTKEFQDQIVSGSGEEIAVRLQEWMRDNYVLAAFVLKRVAAAESVAELPVVAAAAFNKHTYPSSLNGEFALVRMLRWCGFDLDAQEENGMTALHYFASMKVPPYSNPRAVGWLLEHGADPSIANDNGDTPLIYLGASVQWTEELTRSFLVLLNDPRTDPGLKAKDGKTAREIMEETDRMAPNAQRQQLIAELLARAEAEADSVASGGAGAADAEDQLVDWLGMIEQRIEEIRAFYLDEDAQDENSREHGALAWDVSDPEQYLKRVYQMTMGFALQNNLYGRPEFYSAKVVEAFASKPELAKFFNPHLLLPIVDLIHRDFVAQAVTTIPSPDQEKRAKEAMLSLFSSPELRSLVAFPDSDDFDESLHDLWEERRFSSVESTGYGVVARMAAMVHIRMLFDSGWGAGLMGLPMAQGYPDCHAIAVAIDVLKRGSKRKAADGRALVLALIALAMKLSGGLLVGDAVPEEAWSELSPEEWCAAAGGRSGALAVAWGIEDAPYPLGQDVEAEPLTPEAAAFLAMVKGAFSESAERAASAPEARGAADGPAPATAEAEAGASADEGAGQPVSDEDIPPELLAAAKAWRAKGGNLGALGRWAYRSGEAHPTPEGVERNRQNDIAWARRWMGTPRGDKIIAEARAIAARKG